MNAVFLAPRVACEPHWSSRPVSALAIHIAGVYHEHTRERLPHLLHRTDELAAQYDHTRAPHLRGLSALLSQLRHQVETHAWTEDDLLFPVLVAHEHPAVMTTSHSPDALLRLVDTLGAEHIRIRRLLGSLSAHLEAADVLSSYVPGWPELREHLLRLRDHLLEELDLEDRCLLPRARDIALQEASLFK
jgi:iron-sulfur cluster repair protein YtfE (RIC family)